MDQLLKNIKDNWVIIIFLGTIIATWTNFSNAIENHEKRIVSIEETNKQYLTTLQQIQVDVAVVRTKIETIKK